RALARVDRIAGLHPVGSDVVPLAVDQDVAVVDELARRERRGGELGAVDDSVEARLKQRDQVLGGVALAPGRLLVGARELLFGEVAVVALRLLLGAQLQAEIGDLLLAALAVLAWAVGTLVDRGFRAAPDVLAHTPV